MRSLQQIFQDFLLGYSITEVLFYAVFYVVSIFTTLTLPKLKHNITKSKKISLLKILILVDACFLNAGETLKYTHGLSILFLRFQIAETLTINNNK